MAANRRMYKALLPYYGNKRRLCPIIFNKIAKRYRRETWNYATFVDPFLGSGAVSLTAKAFGFKILANDIAERSYIAGKALLENNHARVTDNDIHRLCHKSSTAGTAIQEKYVPDVFTPMQGAFLDNAFSNVVRPLDTYLLIKYIFAIRPYSKFSSPNAFNRPFAEGRYDEIKATYAKHMRDAFKTPLEILKKEKDRINAGIFTNGCFENKVTKMDVFEFLREHRGQILYLDPPYANTLVYEEAYKVLDDILGDTEKVRSEFSSVTGLESLNHIFMSSLHFPFWVISYGNAGGKNELDELVRMVSEYRQCEVYEFSYQHCAAVASEEHKQKSKEWLIVGTVYNPYK